MEWKEEMEVFYGLTFGDKKKSHILKRSMNTHTQYCLLSGSIGELESSVSCQQTICYDISLSVVVVHPHCLLSSHIFADDTFMTWAVVICFNLL